MTRDDGQPGRLVQVLARQTLDVRQPNNAIQYRNTTLASRIICFVDHIVEALGKRPFVE
jgi:hypothetical protein